MPEPPKGIADLEGVVANAAPDATITLPACWMSDLLAYLHALEIELHMQRADEPDTGSA